MVPLELVGVRVEIPANTPMVLLREQEGRHRLLPIYIGSPEASAIHYALEGVVPPRPLTHDLFVNTLVELGAAVTQRRRHRGPRSHVLRRDPPGDRGRRAGHLRRPSDAIALAVRCEAPIYAERRTHRRGRPGTAGRDAEEDADEIIDEFKDFIENVSPEDFGA